MPALDEFHDTAHSISAPAIRVEHVTPSDGIDLARVTRAINVAASGTVALTTIHGDTVDVFVAAGVVFPVRAKRILATGTTATGIRGLS